MAEKIPQTYANHVKTHPPFHFFLLPATLTLLILVIVNAVRHPDLLVTWILVLIGIMAPVFILLIRLNPLKVQDRLIRLEERERYDRLLSPAVKARLAELQESQIVALRFASDAELPALVEKAINSKTSPAELKKAIVTWRADTFRV
jgi:Family of unknown function (DUF6526)